MSTEINKNPKPIDEIRQEFDAAMSRIEAQYTKPKKGLSLPARIFLRVAQAGHPHGRDQVVESGKVQDGEFD